MRQHKQKVSEKKRLANQRNASKSTGPRTPQGKAKSSQNARTHGLFCQEIVLLDEEQSLFDALRVDFIRDLKPQRLCELAMVDKIVESHWKMRRLRLHEAIRHESLFDESFTERMKSPPDLAIAMAEGDHDLAAATAVGFTLQENAKGLERISRYEQRLQNQVHRCYRELRLMREEMEKIAGLPQSPFLSGARKTCAAPPSPHRGEGAGEGRAMCDVEERSVGDELSESSARVTVEELPRHSPLSPALSPGRGEGGSGLAERSQVESHNLASSSTLSPEREGEIEAIEGRTFDADVTCAGIDLGPGNLRSRVSGGRAGL